MIQSSEAYRAAVTGDSRRMLLRAVIDIIDPDITYTTPTSSGQAPFSQPGQLYDKVMEISPNYATLERNRWLLDGSFLIYPDNYHGSGQQGFAGDVLSGDDGTFTDPPWVQLNFSNVSILQACSVYFPGADFDGVPDTFTVEVIQGGTAYFTQTVTGNREEWAAFDGFTVQNPDCVKITVSKWSLPGRRMRIPEIIPGLYEAWTGDMIAAFTVTQQANFACLALPYGTCTLSMDNLDRRFEPRSKDGVFQSIEERQGITVSIGPRLPDGTAEYKQVGVYYQAAGGWTTGDNGLTMTWDLVDIVGLIADREYIPPSSLPTTLGAWVGSIVAQLGTNFVNRYTVDPNYSGQALTCALADVQGQKCGQILMWACMATGTFPRADNSTGNLAVEPFWSQGNKLDLDNLNTYPIMKANGDLGSIIFTLNDGNQTQYVVGGTSAASPDTVSVQNPFIKTQAQALTAARMILSTYGGNQLETTGRGDPSSEIGDVDTVWLNESSATTGRRMSQTLQFSEGVLQGCTSTILQADGSFLFEERAVITQSGTWTAPAGVTQLRVIVGQGGQGGGKGQDGYWESAGSSNITFSGYNGVPGEDGVDGHGGKIWSGTVNINEQQMFQVQIGQGGTPGEIYGSAGQDGEETTFGPYSSFQGEYYPNGYTDVTSGDSFGRTGVSSPVQGSGDGGAGGSGGTAGAGHTYWSPGLLSGGHYEWAVDVEPGPGQPGRQGGSGFVVVYWDKQVESV